MKLPVPLLVLVAALVFRANCREQTDGTDRQAASPEHYLGGLLNPDFSGEDHYLSNGLEGLDYFEDTPLNVGIDEQLKKDVTEKNQIELRGNSGKGSIKKLIKNLESMERRLTQANQQLKMELQAIKEHQSNVTNMNTEFKSDLQSIKEHQANFTNMNTEIKTDLQSINIDITDIKEHQANMTNVNTELKTDLQSIQINLTDSNSELKGEFNILKDNITGYNVKNDVKLDSIRTSLTSIGAVITNHTAMLEFIKTAGVGLCPVEHGYIKPPGSDQCFKALLDAEITWSAAKQKCESHTPRLVLAKPEHAKTLEIRTFLNEKYGSKRYWIGGKGVSGTQMKWERNGQLVGSSSSLWWSTQPTSSTGSEQCLQMTANDSNLSSQPTRPFVHWGCTSKLLPLCERI